MTQLSKAKQNIITDVIKKAAEKEPLSAEELRENIAKGSIVITMHAHI